MANVLLIIVAILGYGFGAVFYKLASNNTHPIMTSAIMVGLYIVLLPIAFSHFKVSTSISSSGFWFSLLGGACTCIGTLCYLFAQKGVGAGSLSAVVSVYPIVTIMVSAIFLGEVFTIRKIIGAAFALAAVVVLTYK